MPLATSPDPVGRTVATGPRRTAERTIESGARRTAAPRSRATLTVAPRARLTVALAVAFVPLFAALVAPAPAAAQDADGLEQTLDAIVQPHVDRGFSGQVLVAVDGEIVFHEGYGPANPETGVPVDTGTVFAIGSVTKRFTRAALLKLAEEGRLSLSDPLSRHLDGLPEDKRDITVAQLLDLTSGLHEYHDDSGDHQAMTKEEAFDRIAGQELLFEPGTERRYSNSGYVLAAMVIEAASGRSFEAYLRSALFEPAGMESTGFHSEERWADARVARGYGNLVHGENAPHRWPYTWALKGAGGMVASAADLHRFNRAVLDGRVLGPDGVAALYPEAAPHPLYAGGDDYGFVSFVVEPDRGRHMVVVNTNAGYEPGAMVLDLAEAATGIRVPPPGRAVVTEEDDGPDATDEASDPARADAAGPGPGDGAPTQGDGLPDSPRGRAAGWIVDALEDGSPDALRALVEERFTPRMRDAVPMDQHLEILGQLSARVREDGIRGVRPVETYVLSIVLGSGQEMIVDIQSSPPHLIGGIRVEG